MKKTYRYSFSKLLIFLIALAIAVCLTSLILSVYRLSLFRGQGTYMRASHYLFVLVSAALLITLISVAISSVYTLTSTRLITRFGIVRSYIELDKITQIKLFEKTEKLVLYFGENSYVVIVVNKAWYDDFTDTILKLNPKIMYDKDSLDARQD